MSSTWKRERGYNAGLASLVLSLKDECSYWVTRVGDLGGMDEDRDPDPCWKRNLGSSHPVLYEVFNSAGS